jgi:hypothetical protein
MRAKNAMIGSASSTARKKAPLAPTIWQREGAREMIKNRA